MASNRGPNAYNPEQYKSGSGNVSSGVGGSWGASTTTTSSSIASQSRQSAQNHTSRHNVVQLSGPTGGAKSDGTYEKNLITELCPPGGMKAEPPPNKLQSFAQSIPSLDPDLICPALLDALEDGQPWIIRAKALCVMEVSINVAEESFKSGKTSNNAYADFFHACKDEIEPLALHSRSAVREPAKKVLKALGLEIPVKFSNEASTAPMAGFAAPAAAPLAAPVTNLLDFDDAPNETPPALPTENPPPLPTENPPAPPATPAVSSCAGSSANLFGGMNVKPTGPPSATTATTTPPQAPAVVTPSTTMPTTSSSKNNITDDLFGEMTEKLEPTVSAPVQAPLKAQNTLFNDMAIKGESPLSVEKENVEVREYSKQCV